MKTARSMAGWVCILLLPLACVGTRVQHTTVHSSAEEPKAAMAIFDCEEAGTVTVRFENRTAVLTHAGKTLRLERVPAASGAKYSNGTTTFWPQGREAVLNLPDEIEKTCTLQQPESVWEEARLRGVDFRAVGNEPGWHLEIDFGKRIRMVTDYGNRRHSFPAPAEPPDPNAAQTTIRARTGDHRLEVVITSEPCRDSMSGEKFEATVRATLDGISFSGCGRRLP